MRNSAIAAALVLACASCATTPRPRLAAKPPHALVEPMDRCAVEPTETAIPEPPAGISGGVFDGMVGDRLVLLDLDSERRVVGAVFDPTHAAWTTVATRGAPRLTKASYGRPLAIGEHLLVSSFTPANRIFDPSRNKWTDAGEWPIAWPWHVVPVDGAWLFWPQDSFDKGFRLDLQRGTWSPIPGEAAPSRRESPAIAACGDQVLVWGGWENHHDENPKRLVPLRDGAAFDIATNRWRPVQLDGAPSARGGAFASCLEEGRAILFGGSASTRWEDSSNPVVSDGAIYDFAADRWTSLSQPGGPEEHQLHNAPPFFSSGGRLAFFRHFNHSVYEAMVLDPAADRWKRLPRPATHGFWTPPIARNGVLHFAAFTLGMLDLKTERWCRPRGEPAPTPTVEPMLEVPPLEVFNLPPRWRAFGAGDGYVLLWGPVTVLDDCPKCPPGAPCLPCSPTIVTGSGGQLFRW